MNKEVRGAIKNFVDSVQAECNALTESGEFYLYYVGATSEKIDVMSFEIDEKSLDMDGSMKGAYNGLLSVLSDTLPDIQKVVVTICDEVETELSYDSSSKVLWVYNWNEEEWENGIMK